MVAPATWTRRTASSTSASPTCRSSRTAATRRPSRPTSTSRSATSRKGTVIWQRFTFANEPGVPWQSSGHRTTYTDWQLVDASGGAGVIEVGDSVQLEVIAAGVLARRPPRPRLRRCVRLGHPGRHGRRHRAGQRRCRGGADLRLPRQQRRLGRAREHGREHRGPGADDVRVGHRPGLLARRRRGDLQLRRSRRRRDRDFTLTVHRRQRRTGTITLGNYAIAGTGYPALLGPARTTGGRTRRSPSPTATRSTEDTALIVDGAGVLANDSDPNGDR